MTDMEQVLRLDNAIEGMRASDHHDSTLDSELQELLGIVQELQMLPAPEFKARLRADLVGHTATVWERVEDVLPTLFGSGWDIYAPRKINFASSMLAHAMAVMVIAYSSLVLVKGGVRLVETPQTALTDLIPSISSKDWGGGGGGRDKTPESAGKLPERSMQPITPATVIRNDNPILAVDATIAVPNEVKIPPSQLPALGNPMVSNVGLASSGIGGGGGLGGGSGIGVGIGSGGGMGGGVFRVGAGVSAPVVLHKVEPEFSPEARAAKYQGVVLVAAVIDSDGKPRDLRVIRGVGMGLDQNAVEAVKQWRFSPAKKDGRPVAVSVNIEVDFRLF
jgi:periplasmic protein TonB